MAEWLTSSWNRSLPKVCWKCHCAWCVFDQWSRHTSSRYALFKHRGMVMQWKNTVAGWHLLVYGYGCKTDPERRNILLYSKSQKTLDDAIIRCVLARIWITARHKSIEIFGDSQVVLKAIEEHKCNQKLIRSSKNTVSVLGTISDLS